MRIIFSLKYRLDCIGIRNHFAALLSDFLSGQADPLILPPGKTMPVWIRRSLFGVMLLSCVIIGARVYLAIMPPSPPAADRPIAAAPEQLPEFTLNDIWGKPHSISEWSGEPLLINFWATWCAPCRREMPLFQTLHNERSVSGIQIVGIAIDRQPDVQSYIAEAGISYPILQGEIDAMAVSDLFGLDGLGLPFSVLVASDGKILTVHIGEIVREQLTAMVEISIGVESGELGIEQARQRLAKL
jgi:thiol-disulfide isomerase/thioredoxin